MISKKLMTFVSAVLAMGLLAGCNSGGSQETKPSGSTSTSTSTSTSISDSGSDTGSQTSSDQSSEGSEDSSSSVEEKTVSQIIVKQGTSLPVSFVVGDTFSVEGGILQVRYSDSTREEIPMTLAMIENAPDMSVAHENYEVNVVYEGARTSYVINVIQGDTRQEVSIGVSYDYNGGDAVELDLEHLPELNFTVGKSYHFYYGCSPSTARDVISYNYVKLGDSPENLGSEKPEAIGNYSYNVFVAEGDDTYKPVKVTINFAIIEVVQKDFLLNAENAPALTDVAATAEHEVAGVTVKYKNAKVAAAGVATLVKQAAADVNPDADDNYVEIASPTLITDALTVNFANEVDKYVSVFGSFDGEHFILLDTLTRVKHTTNRANTYFYLRLVNSSRGEGNNELVIQSISFKYEVDGAPASVVAKAEYSDRINHVSGGDGAYYNREDAYDANYSKKSIGLRLQETYAHIDFGYSIPVSELKYYSFSFKYKPIGIVDYIYTEGGVDYPQDTAGIYMKPLAEGVRVGAHKKVANVAKTSEEWASFDLSDQTFTEGTSIASRFFSGNEVAVTGIDIWLSVKCVGDGENPALVLIDDFRIFQKANYPVSFALQSISLEGMTTEFQRGGAFAFDGTITATYTDGTTAVIPNNDSNLEISEPNMSSSGNKDITVSYTEGGVTKSATYQISVVGADPKAEETLDIIDDAHDLANVSSRRNPELSTYMGCVVASNETEVTYGASQTALRIGGPTPEDYCYFTVMLPETINANEVTVRFFAKGLPCNLILQLRDETETVKAQCSSSITKADVTTDQSKTNKFNATDAGNDWTLYEHDFYTANVTAGVKVLRISFHMPGEVALPADYSCVLDGIQVTAK